MVNILIAIGIVGGLGLALGLALAVASKVFEVKKDERFEKVLEALPGANCGGCGFAGCSAFATAVIEGRAKTDGCPVGGPSCASAVAEIMGMAATGETEQYTAAVLCSGGDNTKMRYVYSGLEDCFALSKLGQGDMACKYGCLGRGSCIKVCQFGAISIKNGRAVVDSKKCVACKQCIDACPKHIIEMIPKSAQVVVLCSSLEKGAILRKACDIGCLGCKLCEKACEYHAITVKDNLASIDYSKCVHCLKCVEKCPRKLISATDNAN